MFFPIFVACLVMGKYFYGEPLLPDQFHSWGTVAGAFFVFLAFSLSCFSYGRFFLRMGKITETALALPLGFLFFCALGAGFGHFGLIGFSFYPLAITVLCLGPAICPPWGRLRMPEMRIEAYLFFLFLAYFFVVFFHTSMQPNEFPDPLWYHLTGPRLFSEAGKILVPEHFPIALKSGFWEMLFLWGNLLLGSTGGGGVIAGQLWGQWMHLLAVSSVFFLLISLGKRLLGFTNQWRLALLILLCFGSKELFLVAPLAKNDWGSIAFSFAGLLSSCNGYFWLAGIFWGAAFASKYTVAFFLLGLVIFLPRTKMAYLRHLGGFFLGAAPVLIRNLVLTGNPFFPAMNQFFRSAQLGPSWENLQDFSGRAEISFVAKVVQAKELFLQSPGVVLFLVFSAYLWANKKIERKLLFSAGIPLVVFFLVAGPRAEVRLLGPALLWLIFCGYSFAQLCIKEERVLAIGFFASFFLQIEFSGFPQWKPWMAPNLAIQEHLGGKAEYWLREKFGAERKFSTVSGNETRIYYQIPIGSWRIWDDPALDRDLAKATNTLDLYKALEAHGVQKMLLTHALVDSYFDLGRWTLLVSALHHFPETVIFSNERERVVDVPLMRKKLEEFFAENPGLIHKPAPLGVEK